MFVLNARFVNNTMDTDLIFLIGRILFGGFFAINGFNHFTKMKMLTGYTASKGVPMAGFMVVLTGIMLFLGGLGIVLGIYIEIAATLIAVFLLFVSFAMHNFWKVQDPNQKMSEMINFMKNIALLGAALMMLMIPAPWPFSVF